MIAVDTNILVYAHRAESEWFDRASAAIRGLAEGSVSWAIPWPCLHEFLAIVSHSGIYRPPTAMIAAIQQIEYWMESPSLRIIGEAVTHWRDLVSVMTRGKIRGGAVHDARIAAICLGNGVQPRFRPDANFKHQESPGLTSGKSRCFPGLS
jgi:uncharacterized protein